MNNPVDQVKAYFAPILLTVIITFGGWLGTEIYRTTKETAKEVAGIKNELVEIKVKLGYTETTVRGHTEDIKHIRELLSFNQKFQLPKNPTLRPKEWEN